MKTFTRQLLRTFLFILLICSVFYAQAQLVKPFRKDFQTTQKGGIVFLANVNVGCAANPPVAGGTCQTGVNQVPPGGTYMDNDFNGVYVDIDGDPSTFSSSSDSLRIPDCSDITWAGLYWAALGNAATTPNYRNIKIKVNNGAYLAITADSSLLNTAGYTSYSCMKDITNLVRNAGNKSRFTVADISFNGAAANNEWGGWCIVVVYKNDLQNMRQLTVFDGLSNVSSSQPATNIPISGFLTPLSGPVTMEFGAVVWDGDRSLTGDQLLFNGAGSFVNISDALNTSNDVMNSTVSRNAVLTPFRKPNLNNTAGLDADIFFPDNSTKNYIGNSATSGTFRVTTSSETILTQVITMAIDVYSPDNRTGVKVVDINGGLTVPGDTLQYNVTCKNIGSDPSINTYVIDSLEGNINFVPGSIRIVVGPNSGAKTDAAGDDQAEYDATGKRIICRIGTGANAVTGGQVNDSPFGNDSTLFTFRTTVVSNCDVLYCDNIVDNSAYIIGTGNVSGITYTNASNPNIFDAYGCPIPGATKTVITAAQCPQYPDTSLVACTHQNFDVLYTRPGFTFYNSSWVSVVKPTAAGTYYGVHPIGIYCLDTVVITVSSYVFCNGPTANDDNGPALSEDGPNGTVNVITNDTDADGNPTAPVNGAGEFTVDLDPATPGVQSTYTDAQGVWTVNTATGEVVFDPADNYNGTAVITYTLCDPSALCDNATITFVVAPVNDPPVANDDMGPALTEDGPNGTVNVITNDTDVEGNPTAPVNGVGQFTVDLDPGTAGIQTTFTDAQGVWTLNTAAGVVTFDPANNYNGTATIPYTLCDPAGACDNADITFVVTPVNDPPVANDDNGADLTEDGPNGTVNVLTNDTDPDGNPTAPVNGVGQFTVDLDVGTPGVQSTYTDAQGVWTLNTATGDVTFDPANNYNGPASIPYTLCDPSGLCDGATIGFVVYLVNDPPVAINDVNNTLINTPVDGNLLTNDFEPEGNPLTINTTPVSNPTNGNVVINPDGSYTYTPNTGYTGTDTFIYQVCDNGSPALCDQAVVTITIYDNTPSNDPPVAVNDAFQGNINTIVTGSVITNDFDPDNNLNPNSVTLSGPAPANGILVLNPDGSFTFTPNPGFTGQTSFNYQVCDNGTPALCDIATATIDILALPPVNTTFAVDDAIQVNEDGIGNGNVLSNDYDPQSNLQTVNTTPVQGPANGTLILNANGSYTYTPDPNYNGPDQFIYEVCDNGTPVVCDQATVYITVIPVNDPPVAINDVNNTFINTPVSGNLLTNDFEPEGDPIIINTTPVSNPTNGNVVINPDGSYTYTPNPGYTGTDTFIYQVCDNGSPALCDQAVVTITVYDNTPLNDPPVAVNDAFQGSINTIVTGSVITNDFDPDNNLNPNSVTLSGPAPANGVLVLNPDGTFTFTPNPGFYGQTSFDYQVCDNGTPALCDIATATIDILALPPVNTTFAVDDAIQVNEDGIGNGNVLGNDYDPESNLQTVNTTPVQGPANGTLILNANGSYTYTPDPNYNGPDQFIYEVCDNGTPVACDQATVYITVIPLIDPPIATNDVGAILTEDGANGTINLLSNDSDPDGNPSGPVNGPGQFTIDLDPATPGLQTTFTDPQGVWTLNTTTGEVTFDPADNFNGTASIPYRLCDPTALCSDATISFDVIPVNDPPLVADDNATTNEDTPVTFNIAANDFDIDGPMDPTSIDLDPATPGQQTLLIVPGEGTYILNPATGDVTFIPYANFNGTTTPVPYTICDNGVPLPVNCDQANITVTVNADNDPPTANDNAANTNSNTPVTFNIISNDFDIDGAIDPATIDLDPATPGNQTTFTIPGQGTYTVNTSVGDVTFTPALNFSGIVTPVTYSVCDNGTPLPAQCDQAVISMEVILTNIAPVANDDGATTPEDTPITFSITANDTDIDGVIDPATIDLDPSTPGNQTTLIIPGQGTYVANTTTGDVTFAPALNFNGPVNAITYSVCDNGIPVYCDQATIDLIVTPVNDVPVVNVNSVSTSEETPVTFNVIGNDIDVEGFVDPASIDLDQSTPGYQTTLTIPGEGTYTANTTTGEVTFTPDTDFNGQATPVIYSACDNNLPPACDTAFIVVYVNGVNDPPVANPDTYTINEDNTLNSTVVLNDSDVDNNLIPTGFAVVNGPSNGTLNFSNNGLFSYTPNADYTGTDTFIYMVCDLGMPVYCDTALVTINVLPVNDPPVIVEPPVVTPEDTPVTVCTTISDPDAGSVFTASLCGPPANGTITSGPTVVGNQVCFTYLPNTNFNGVDNVCVIVCDSTGLCDTSTSVITVVPVNDPLVANPDNFTTNEDTQITGTVITNDSDVDGNLNPNGYAVVSYPTNGTLIFSNNGTFTYTPNANFNGTDSFIYSLCDLGMPVYCDTALVTINVLPINDPPVIVEPPVVTPEDTPVTVCTIISDPDAGSVFTASLCGPPANGTITSGPTVVGNQVCFTYMPNTNFNGIDNVCVIVCDSTGLCDTSTSVITVVPVNDPLVANPDNFTTNEDTPITGTVINNDSDLDGNMNTTGFAIVSGTSNGTINFSNNGTFTYTPNPDYYGTDTFIYMVCDFGMPIYCDTALVTINVLPVNDPPIAVDDIVTTPEDTPVSGNILTNDSDPEGDALTIVDFTVNGTTYPAGTTVTIPGVGVIVIDSTGNYTFTPDPNYNGPVPTVTYTITDGNGGFDQADLDIFVGMVNDPPVAVNDTVNTPEDTPVSGNALTNDSDIDGGPLSIVSFVVNGVTYPAGATVNMPGYGVITVYSNGLFNFTPAADFNGSVPAIPYTITDGSGGLATADIIITVTPVNDPPEIVEPAVVTPEDTPITVCTTITDPDANSVFTASLCGLPTNGTITSGPTVNGNQVCFTYLPNTNFNGIDNVCVVVCDSTGLCDSSTSVITVVPVNDPLIADPDYFTTNEDTPITGTVITNDSDVDGNMNPTGFAIVSGPSNGTINFSNNGTFTYTQNPNYNGTDTFIYMVCDFGMPIYCDTALVTINVLPVDDAPVIPDLTVTTPEDTPITVCLPITDPDANSVFTASLCGNPSNGSITSGPTVLGNQVCVTYLPNTDFNGVDQVCITVCDNSLDSVLCDNGVITINVTPVNDPVIANPDYFTTNEDTPVTGTVITNDSDVDGNMNPTGFALVSGTSNGTITFSNNGTFTYTPDPNYYGPDSFIYMVCDFGMPIYCDTAIVYIDVNPVNDVPVVFNEQISQCEGTSTSVNVLLNADYDPEGTTIIVDTILVSGPLHGTATVTTGGLLTYTPATGYFGPDYVVVAVCDQGIPLPSACSNDTIFINVDQSVTAFAGNDQQFCDDDLDFFTLTGNAVPYGNVQWTQVSGPPAIITPANSNIAAAFINHVPGTYVFQYSVTNGTCSASSQVTYTLSLPPTVADAGPDQELCGANFTTLTGNVPLVGSGVWAQLSGPDTANIIYPNQPTTVIMGLIPGTYVFSWTISNGPLCDPSVDFVTITIIAPTTAFAGPNETICEGGNYILSNATATNAVSVHWTTSGTGQFIDANVLNPTYIPSLNDILDGYVYLTINATATSPCPNVSSTMTLFISHHAIVSAGPDDIICSTQGSYTLSGSSSQNAVSYQWTTSGTGTFFNGTSLHPVYTPSPADIAAGAVTLTLVATSPSPCPSASDNMVLTISPQAVVNAGSDAVICESGTYTLSGATAQYATNLLWTTSGTGTFDDATILHPLYTPSLNDILDGHVDLTLTATSIAPCTITSDVMTLTINHQAIVNAGPDYIICETQGSYTVSGSTSQFAVGYSWSTSGTGTFVNGNTLHPVYTPSPADINFGSVILTIVANSASPCPNSTDAMILTISRQAVISAGTDATICETGTYALGGSTAQFATGLIWSTSGTGSFNNPNILHPVYTPSLNDIQDGFVFLTLTANSASPCTMVTDVMRLNISHQVSNVYAGADATICETATYTLSDATELNATSVLWTTSGTGTFNNNTLLHATYDPSPADVAAGSVTLTLTANSAIPCPSVSDAMILYFSLQAVSSAGPDGVVCEGSSFTLNGATATNATSYIWTTSGSGTFADPSILHAVYTPSAADILNGSITLTLITTSQAPCGNAPADAMLLTISHKPVIYAGADTAICQNVSYFVDDATALYSSSLFWTTTGAGTILNGNTLNPTYVPGPGETGVIMLTLNAISSVACGSDTTTDFMYLTIMESIIANAGQDTTIFANNSVTLHGSASNGSGAYSYNWEPATLLVFENTDHPITDPLSTTTIFVVTVTDLVTGCQDQDTVVITVDGINLPPVAVDDYDTTEYQTCITFPILLNDYDPDSTSLTVSLCGPPVNGIVVINSDNTLTYCPYDGFSGEDSLCYQICDNGSPILCDQATVYIHVKPEFTLDDLIIYNGVSPNGDGDNDVWNIFGIEFFPDNEVTIFNRWGDVIANYTHYNNKDVSWDATYKGKQVPDGTYYYLLDIKNKKKFTGWIYVKTGK